MLVLSVPLLRRTSVGGGGVQWSRMGRGEQRLAAPDEFLELHRQSAPRSAPPGIHRELIGLAPAT